MELLPFGDLAPYKPRAFVPADLKLDSWEAIEPFFNQLAERIGGCESVADL